LIRWRGMRGANGISEDALARCGKRLRLREEGFSGSRGGSVWLWEFSFPPKENQ